MMFRELDWSTPVGKIVLANHRRILLCIVVGAIFSTFIWHAFFPNTLWFIKLWTGFATGALIGVISGTWWQLRDCERHSKTSGRFVVIAVLAWGTFAGISMFLWAPDLYAQERERSTIRSLKTADISAITIRLDGQQARQITDVQEIDSFIDRAKNANLFYPSHEGSLREFEIEIHHADGKSLQYHGRIPERHQGDFSLDFRGYFVRTEIIIPDGRHWLDLVTREIAR